MPTFFDFETRSKTDIRYGTDRYSTGAEAILLSFARDEAPPQLWDIVGGQPMLPDFADAIADPNEPLVAHNTAFDRTIMKRCLGIDLPIRRYRDTLAQSYSHGLPGSLEMLGIVLEIPVDEQKRADEKQLIQLFCCPNEHGKFYDRYTHILEWDRFCDYSLWDSIALRSVFKKLPAHNYTGINLQAWWLDQLINERGFGFDVPLATAAQKLLGFAKQRQDMETDALTGGAAWSATQRGKLLAWFEQSGLKLPNMKAATMREWLTHDDLDPVHRLMIELRLEAAKSSGSKYRRGLEIYGERERIRWAKQFNGAGRTGRWSGRGFQPDNMMRPVTAGKDAEGNSITLPVDANYIEAVIIPGIMSGEALSNPLLYGGPNEACANALRGAIIPDAILAENNELSVSDWSNIEGRVLAWLAEEQWKLDAYRAQDRGEAVDGYKLLFSRFFGVDPSVVNDQERQMGKVIDLACGFGGSVGAFVAMAAGYNMDLDKVPDLILPKADPAMLKKAEKAWKRAFTRSEDYGLSPRTFIGCHILVQLYRQSNAAINDLRYEVDRATKDAVRNPGKLFNVAKCKIWSTGSWLIIQLPSGRRLTYCKPKMEVKRETDPETGKVSTSEYISYMTARGKSWRRESAWSGLFIENIVQAIANDILRAGLLMVHEDTLSIPEIVAYLQRVGAQTAICLHVHDEIATDVPVGSYPKKRIVHAMTTMLLERHSWMRGLPLAAKAWIGKRFKK